MSNLYNLFENFNFYLEAFRNIESNKTFVSSKKDFVIEVQELVDSINYFLTPDNSVSQDHVDAMFDTFLKSYSNTIKILKDFSNDKVHYNNNNALFSIDLEKKEIDNIQKIYDDFIKEPSKELLQLLKKNVLMIGKKIFAITILTKNPLNGFQVYDIFFSNLQFQTSSPKNKQKGLINKDYRIIFSIILGFSKKLNIDFDKSIFHLEGTVEGEKDRNKNRRLTAYHLVHKGLINMKYNDIDEKELSNAFKNKEIHPFLYRKNKDEMYISISKNVDLTKVFDNKKKKENIK